MLAPNSSYTTVTSSASMNLGELCPFDAMWGLVLNINYETETEINDVIKS